MYNKIINPKTNRKVNITSKLGKHILNNYIMQIGGSCSSDTDCKTHVDGRIKICNNETGRCILKTSTKGKKIMKKRNTKTKPVVIKPKTKPLSTKTKLRLNNKNIDCIGFKNNKGKTCPKCCSAHNDICKWVSKKGCQSLIVRGSVGRASVKPAIKPAIRPAIRPVIKPAIRPAIKPAIKPAIRPAIKPAVFDGEQLSKSPNLIYIYTTGITNWMNTQENEQNIIKKWNIFRANILRQIPDLYNIEIIHYDPLVDLEDNKHTPQQKTDFINHIINPFLLRDDNHIGNVKSIFIHGFLPPILNSPNLVVDFANIFATNPIPKNINVLLIDGVVKNLPILYRNNDSFKDNIVSSIKNYINYNCKLFNIKNKIITTLFNKCDIGRSGENIPIFILHTPNFKAKMIDRQHFIIRLERQYKTGPSEYEKLKEIKEWIDYNIRFKNIILESVRIFVNLIWENKIQTRKQIQDYFNKITY